MTGENLSSFPNLRRVLTASAARMPAESIEALFDSHGMSAADVDNFLGTLQRIGQGVVSALPQVLPAVLPVVGTAFGGPVGGAVGALAGQAIGQAIGPAQPAGAPRPAAPPVVPPAALGSPQPAAQLLQTMFRPETLQALIAMLLGSAGRDSVPVAGTPVPVAAFANTLEVLAGQTLAGYQASGAASGGRPDYLGDYTGDDAVDTAVPEHRAVRLLELLDLAERHESTGSRTSPRFDPGESEASGSSSVELYDYYDALELAELNARLDAP